MPWVTRAGDAAMVRAIHIAASSRSSGAVTSDTSPDAMARAALSRSEAPINDMRTRSPKSIFPTSCMGSKAAVMP